MSHSKELGTCRSVEYDRSEADEVLEIVKKNCRYVNELDSLANFRRLKSRTKMRIISHDIKANVRSFRNGVDQKAYDALMGIVRENAANSWDP